MRALLLKQSLFHVRTLLALSLALLVGCERSTDAPSVPDEINSLLTVFSSLATSPELTNVESINRSNNSVSIRATFNTGLAFEMETDRDFQGYEYLAYAAADSSDPDVDALYLLDYALNASTRVRKLQTFEGRICAITPVFEEDDQLVDENDIRTSGLLNKNTIIVTIALNPTSDCSLQTTSFEVTFDFSLIRNQVQVTQLGNASLLLSMIEYGSIAGIKGQSFLVYGNGSGGLRLENSDGETVWDIAIPDGSDTAILTQVNNNTVIIQTDARVYVKTVTELADAAEFNANDNQTVEERVFGSVYYELVNADLDSPIQAVSDGTETAFADGLSLIYFDSVNNEFDSIADLNASVSEFELAMMGGAQLLAITRFADREELSVFSATGDVWNESQDIVGGLASDKIEMAIVDTALFVNTLNLAQNGSNMFWQAHYFRDIDLPGITLDRAAFAISFRVDKDQQDALLYTSFTSDAAGNLLNPALYAVNIGNLNNIFATLENLTEIDTDSNFSESYLIAESVGDNLSLSEPNILAEGINDEFIRHDPLFDEEGLQLDGSTQTIQLDIDPRTSGEGSASTLTTITPP